MKTYKIDGVRYGKCKSCLKEGVELYNSRLLCKPCFRVYTNNRRGKTVLKTRDCLGCGIICQTRYTLCKSCRSKRQKEYNNNWKQKRQKDYQKQIIRDEYLEARINFDDGSSLMTGRGFINREEVLKLLNEGFGFILVDDFEKILKRNTSD